MKEWEIEKIINAKLANNSISKYKYLIKWVNWDNNCNEWIHKDYLPHANKMIEDYWNNSHSTNPIINQSININYKSHHVKVVSINIGGLRAKNYSHTGVFSL